MPQNTSESRDPAAVARGELIHRARVTQGLTQKETAAFVTQQLRSTDPTANLSREHLAQIETGRSGMSDQKLRAIAAVLGIKEASLRLPLLIADAA